MSREIKVVRVYGPYGVGKMPPAPPTESPGVESVGQPNVFAALEALTAQPDVATESTEHSHGHGHGKHHVAEMKKVVNLIQDCGVHYDSYNSEYAPELT